MEPSEKVCNVHVRGVDIIRDPLINKGTAFSIKERQLLGIHGLLPPCVHTQDQQVFVCMQNFYRWDNNLDRYIYLMGLQDRNEKLFYRLVTENVETMMPVIYTPTVGLACQKYGLIFRKPRGLFMSINDAGHLDDILNNWPEQDVKAIVVTDGERILGLGDLGCYGMGIPVGKLSLYTACAGVQPHQCLPITLDVGTNNEKLLKDPLYIGLRQRREHPGPKYDDFMDEFMKACVKRYGQNVLIQFEDFGNHNAFRLLEKYRNKYCTFNDDIQGTAAVSVSGLITASHLTGKRLSDQKFLFQGAGEAAIGIAKLIVRALVQEGLSEEEALGRVWLVDSRGLIVKNRPKGGLNEEKMPFAKDHSPIDELGEVVKTIKPDAIIGVAAVPGSFTEQILKDMGDFHEKPIIFALSVAAVPGAFTEQILKDMGDFHEKPIIFALSNPTSKAECTAEQAYTLTGGRAIFASGSPFDPVKIGGKKLVPGQGNNAYIFPGMALGIILCGVRHIDEIMFLKAAEVLSSTITKEDLAEGRVYPPLDKIRDVSSKIAIAMVEYAYKTKQASLYPEPEDKAEFVTSQMYHTDYESFLPTTYDWPETDSPFGNPLQGPFCYRPQQHQPANK